MIPALRAFARGFYRNVNDADDLVQETLLKGIANMHRYQPGTNMKSWLFTAVGTVKSRLNRDRQRLVESLGEDRAGEERRDGGAVDVVGGVSPRFRRIAAAEFPRWEVG